VRLRFCSPSSWLWVTRHSLPSHAGSCVWSRRSRTVAGSKQQEGPTWRSIGARLGPLRGLYVALWGLFSEGSRWASRGQTDQMMAVPPNYSHSVFPQVELHMSLRARQPRQPGCEPQNMRADQRCQGTNGPPRSAGMPRRGGGTTAAAAPRNSIRARRRRIRKGQGQEPGPAGAIPTCARIFRITAGSCSVAISRSRSQRREPLFAFAPTEPAASADAKTVGSGATRPYATTRARQRARAVRRPWRISRFVSGRGA
jgi:hypothetical protein